MQHNGDDMVKGFSYMIELAVVVFIFLMFSFTVMSSYSFQKYNDRIMKIRMARIYEFLDMKGSLRDYGCMERTTQLENEIDKYADYGFDVSICNGICTPYVVPPWKDVSVYRRYMFGCNSSKPELISTFMWVKS